MSASSRPTNVPAIVWGVGMKLLPIWFCWNQSMAKKKVGGPSHKVSSMCSGRLFYSAWQRFKPDTAKQCAFLYIYLQCLQVSNLCDKLFVQCAGIPADRRAQAWVCFQLEASIKQELKPEWHYSGREIKDKEHTAELEACRKVRERAHSKTWSLPEGIQTKDLNARNRWKSWKSMCFSTCWQLSHTSLRYISMLLGC